MLSRLCLLPYVLLVAPLAIMPFDDKVVMRLVGRKYTGYGGIDIRHSKTGHKKRQAYRALKTLTMSKHCWTGVLAPGRLLHYSASPEWSQRQGLSFQHSLRTLAAGGLRPLAKCYPVRSVAFYPVETLQVVRPCRRNMCIYNMCRNMLGRFLFGLLCEDSVSACANGHHQPRRRDSQL